MDTTLYIDQNVSQACQPGFLKIWGVWIFFPENPGDFSLSRDILKSEKIVGLQATSLLFESVSSSIEVLGVLLIYYVLNADIFILL